MIRRAHRVRKLVGGGMRQIGILAAAAIYALDHHVERLAEDHEMRFASPRCLLNCRRSRSIPVRSRPTWCLPVFPKVLRRFRRIWDSGILINLDAPHIRLVTHLDCRADEIDLFVEEVKGFLPEQGNPVTKPGYKSC